MNQEQIELIKSRVAGSADVDHSSYMNLADTAFKRDIPALLHDHATLTRQLERANREAKMWEFAYKGTIAELQDRRKGIASAYPIGDSKQTIANARLIACAPNLLAGCKELLDAFDHSYHIDMDSTTLARAAIAEAEGEKP